MAKMIVAGGRNLWLTEEGFKYLELMVDNLRITEIVSGMAPGVDTAGAWWAKRNGIEVTFFPADWQRFGDTAGPRRNLEMLTYAKGGHLIVYKGGKGSANVIKQAYVNKKPIINLIDLRERDEYVQPLGKYAHVRVG